MRRHMGARMQSCWSMLRSRGSLIRRLLPRRDYRNGAMSAARRSCTAGYNGVPLERSAAVRGLFQR